MTRRPRSGAPAFSLFAFQDIVTCVMGIMLLITLMMSLQIETATGTGMDPEMLKSLEMLSQESQGLLNEVDTLERQVAEQLSLLNTEAIFDVQILGQSREMIVNEVAAARNDLVRLEELRRNSDDRLKDVSEKYSVRQEDNESIQQLQQENHQLEEKLQQLRNGQRRVYNSHDSASKDCWLVEISESNDIQVALIGENKPPQRFASLDDLIGWVKSRKGHDVAFMLLIKPNAADSLEELTKELVELAVPFGFDLLPQDATAIDAASGTAAQ